MPEEAVVEVNMKTERMEGQVLRVAGIDIMRRRRPLAAIGIAVAEIGIQTDPGSGKEYTIRRLVASPSQ